MQNTIAALRARLLAARTPKGHWLGHLSSSALSTATATFALASVDARKYRPLVDRGLRWLCENQNADGGWGDTTCSPSNLSTTMLCYSALVAGDGLPECAAALKRTEGWLHRHVGSLQPRDLAEAVTRQYGKDRTFSVPILTMCALAGRLGSGWRAWTPVKPLPFELAALPQRLYKWLRLPVVSYALPALIAIGQVRYEFLRPLNPPVRLIRHMTRRKSLRVLASIQPANGGFLEAAPLTSFVVMSLAAFGLRYDRIVSRSVNFLVKSIRDDGSWPIDTNLATWVTTLSTVALSAGDSDLLESERAALVDWLLTSQHRVTHPYTQAAPGGWAWSNLAGAVPDADDTAGAILALHHLGVRNEAVSQAVTEGINWLLGLQNRDGGIPTFCRGWTRLPFDKSAPDITAHAVGAMGLWLDTLEPFARDRTERAIRLALAFLQDVQRQDGAWVPLWFGNQASANKENPVYGTARALTHLSKVPQTYRPSVGPMCERAIGWLLSVQNVDGGWGGGPSIASTLEETALAVEALVEATGLVEDRTCPGLSAQTLRSALGRGVQWLIARTEVGQSLPASPIGLYFAQLWYSEELYPVIFALAALEKSRKLFAKAR